MNVGIRVTIKRSAVGLGIMVLAFALVAVFTVPTQADLPARPTATPVPRQDTSLPQGAHIVLQTQVGVWSVVQWQDVNGDWHDVDGWRGTATNGTVEWWVAQKDFGTGPFRWAVSQSPGGEISAASKVFTLPAASGEILTVTVP